MGSVLEVACQSSKNCTSKDEEDEADLFNPMIAESDGINNRNDYLFMEDL